MLDHHEMLEYAIRLERAGSIDQAVEAFQRVVNTADEPEVVARALRHQADVHRVRCEWTPALELARRSAETAKSVGSMLLFAEALNAEAIIHQSRGAFDIAVPLLEQVLTLVDDDRIRGSALQNLGSIAAMNKDFDAARARFQESYEAFHRAGYRRGEVIAGINGSAIANDCGDHEEAHEMARKAMAGARKLQDYDALAHASLNCALALIGLEDFDAAEDLLSTAFGFFAIEANSFRQVAALRILGDLNHRRGNRNNAERCYRHALEIATRIEASGEAAQLEDRLAEIEAEAESNDPRGAGPESLPID